MSGFRATVTPVRLIIILLAAAALTLLGWRAYPRLTGIYPLAEADQSEALVSRRHAATEKTIDVLFIGNSFTFTHGMPAMLVNLASGDPANPVRLRVWTVTRGGATLADHRAAGQAAQVLASRSFDYVVLNQQSSWAYVPESVSDTNRDVAYWSRLIRSQGAQPVLLETWADGAASSVYASGGWLHSHTATDAQEKISEETADLARLRSLSVVRVGQAFQRAQRDLPTLGLFQADQHHPSVAGAYLSAASFYRFLTGRSAGQSTYRPRDLTDIDARQLAAIASE